MGTGPDDGSDTQLYLEVQEVVPRVLKEQVLKKKEAFVHIHFRKGRLLQITAYRQSR